MSLQIPRPLMVRLKKEAARRGISVTELVTELLSAATANIDLSVDELRAIYESAKEAQKTGRRVATRLDGSTGSQGKARTRQS